MLRIIRIAVIMAAVSFSGVAFAVENPFLVQENIFSTEDAKLAGETLQKFKSKELEKVTDAVPVIITDGFGGTLVIYENSAYKFDSPTYLIEEKYSDARNAYKEYLRKDTLASVIYIAMYVVLLVCLMYTVISYAAKEIREHSSGKYGAEKCAVRISAATILALQFFNCVEIEHNAEPVDAPVEALAKEFAAQKYEFGDIEKLLSEYQQKYQEEISRGSGLDG